MFNKNVFVQVQFMFVLFYSKKKNVMKKQLHFVYEMITKVYE